MKRIYLLYRIARPIIKVFMKLTYHIQVIGASNIPESGKCIIAGNHTSNLDALLVISSTKRTIRFLAKKELTDNILGPLFLSAGVIPVDRSKKDKEVKEETLRSLQDEELICIFPEGTINRTSDLIMPFKYGTVSFARKSSSLVVPFVIKGKYKLFRKSVQIKFLKPINIETDNLEKENKRLMEIIKEELTND